MGKRPFIADDDEDVEYEESAESDESLPKKSNKKSKSKKKEEVMDDSSSEEEERPISKKRKVTKSPKKSTKSRNKDKEDEEDEEPSLIHTNEDGEKYLQLGKKRRATVRSFKGTPFVDIREFYEQNGEEKPGKKGISLNLEQWEILKNNTEIIDSFFAKLKK
ncbi:transcriptional coactivator PC4 family protein [Abortiporus biennis]